MSIYSRICHSPLYIFIYIYIFFYMKQCSIVVKYKLCVRKKNFYRRSLFCRIFLHVATLKVKNVSSKSVANSRILLHFVFSLLHYLKMLWFYIDIYAVKWYVIPEDKIKRQSNAAKEKEILYMALTRKMLAAMDVPAEKIDEIINAHVETVNAIKEERDSFKADAEKLAGVEEALKEANKQLEKFKADDWEKKYTDLKTEYDSYKNDTQTKAVKTAKEAAYKQLLLDAGISDKRIASILKVSDVDGVALDDDGKIKDADKLTESIKTEWADFITTDGKKGAETPTPPKGDDNGSDQPSVAKQLAEAYQKEHYGAKED